MNDKILINPKTGHLKSSMDRFIVSYHQTKTNGNLYLKSSMDRFIVSRKGINIVLTQFKIQYG